MRAYCVCVYVKDLGDITYGVSLIIVKVYNVAFLFRKFQNLIHHASLMRCLQMEVIVYAFPLSLPELAMKGFTLINGDAYQPVFYGLIVQIVRALCNQRQTDFLQDVLRVRRIPKVMKSDSIYHIRVFADQMFCFFGTDCDVEHLPSLVIRISIPFFVQESKNIFIFVFA